MFDDFVGRWGDYANKIWQTTLDELVYREPRVTPNEETSSDWDSSEDGSDKEVEDLDDLDLQGLTEAIDRKARNAKVYQQSALQLADQCRVLVNAYYLWEETYSVYTTKMSSLSAQARVTYQVSSWVSEKNLGIDLKRILSFLQSFDISPELFSEDLTRVSTSFSNALKLLCGSRPFIRLTDVALSTAQLSMKKSIRYDEVELRHLISSRGFTKGRTVDQVTAIPCDPGKLSTSSLAEPSHLEDHIPGRHHPENTSTGGDVAGVIFRPGDAKHSAGLTESPAQPPKITLENLDKASLQGIQRAPLSGYLIRSALDLPKSKQDATSFFPAPTSPKGDTPDLVSLESNNPIGHGGFGDLFLGTHSHYGKVALKRPRARIDEALLRRFLREIDLWCSVSHPHILPCLGMCKIGLDVYAVSPYIENGDLMTCLARGMVLNCSKLLYEVAEGLTHLHHRGIIHGDVKAQNVLLSDNGAALLCDFGLAKAFDTMVTSTESKGAGSVRWMAPEIFLGESRSMASDVYSLGITIAEVLSGRPPYQHISDSLAVMYHVAQLDARPAKEPLMSPEGKSYATLWEAAEKCWVRDVKARPYMVDVLGMLFPLTREMAQLSLTG